MTQENGGSVDMSILRHLYCEPIKEDDLRKALTPRGRREVRSALARLQRKSLVVTINKDDSEPIYKITRQGQRVLEDLMVQRSELCINA